jgi:SpoVK/Ycf46/Vps4 family AAA+-type ATPase
MGESLDEIALRYRLGAGGIERAADAARLIASARGEEVRLEIGDLIAGVRNNIAERLGELARRVEVKQSWDDLVLAPDLIDQIHALIARVRHAHRVYEEWAFSKKAARGIGVPVLFSGPPGTGKTLVAGIIARELDLELLQVDLSQVVSKWIGETEKQLSKVFDAAEAGHALLLFDEADALFAKRTTEVKGATDRYANLEVNYLLQRIESFGGITILTTNLDASLDKALRRRLASHIVFFQPDDDEREELWQRILHTGAAPTAGEFDFAKLSRQYPDMTGANIRNAVLAAAFLAASEDSEITQDHLERAAKGEYRTMGRVLR